MLLKCAKGKADYPEGLRHIRYVDPEASKSLTFITKHFGVPALTVVAIGKSNM